MSSIKKVKFKTDERKTFTLVEFEIEGGILARKDLKNIVPPEVDATKGVGISGRGPVWLFTFLTHYYHPTAFVGPFEPREQGIVVTQVHSENAGVEIGDLIPV